MKAKKILINFTFTVFATVAIADDTLQCVSEYNAASYQAAFQFCHAAALHGEVLAKFNLGNMYYIGLGTAQNFNEAVRWYREAAEEDFVLAQTMLANLYVAGEGVSQNFR